jgi:hypothetical protein
MWYDVRSNKRGSVASKGENGLRYWYGGLMREVNHLGDLSTDGRVLKQIFNKWML